MITTSHRSLLTRSSIVMPVLSEDYIFEDRPSNYVSPSYVDYQALLQNRTGTRVLLLVRDPIDRLVSALNFYLFHFAKGSKCNDPKFREHLQDLITHTDLVPFRSRVRFKEPDDILQLTVYDDFLVDMYEHARDRTVDVIVAEHLFDSSTTVLSYFSRVLGEPVTRIPHSFPRNVAMNCAWFTHSDIPEHTREFLLDRNKFYVYVRERAVVEDVLHEESDFLRELANDAEHTEIS